MPIQCSGCGQDNREGSNFCLRCGDALDLDPEDSLLGRMLSERYRLVSVIGEGGMGRVYAAEQQIGTSTRSVAVKVLHATHSRDETLRRRFYRECDVVAQLSHPNTIQFFDFGELPDGRLFIVMEHVEGHSLGRALSAGPLPLARAERILAQIAGSLSEAHAHGVIHRDLKPDNILLTTRGGEPDFVKVCDFGIAKRASSAEGSQLTMEGTVVGTPQYMSPEQLTGGPIDARSDVYSLGLILYEMLTGVRPFTASSLVEWAARHATAEPPPLESFEATRDLPEEKKRAVMRALAKLPSERPASVRELAVELLGTSETSAWLIMASPPSLVVRPTPTPHTAVDVAAPTQHASPAALRRRDLEPETTPAFPPARRSRLATAGALLGALGLIGAATGALVASGALDQSAASSDASLDASAEAGHARVAIDAAIGDPGPRERGPSQWIRIVHMQRNVENAALALGPPDDQYAVLLSGATLVLELAAGTRIASDGEPGADLLIVVDEERSGAYRADLGVAPNRYTTVGSELLGSLPLDADQFELTRVRYVRIKNRSRQRVYVDAVGAYRVIPMEAGEAG